MVASLVIGASADYTVQAGDTLVEIAAEHGISAKDLAAANNIANPDLIHIGLVLVIPAGSGQANGPPPTVHVVAAGETLGSIALQYGTTTQALAAANGLPNPNLIRIGQQLTVGGGATPTPSVTPGSTHTVQPGESLAAIAAQYGTTPEALAAANGIIPPYVIYAGTTLRLTGEPFVAATAASESTYLVAPGDTLGAIAARYGTTSGQLATVNLITDPNLITVGQSLRVPTSSWICPVSGARYFNDWGFPRSGGRVHEGTDLFAPRGTEVRAPVSGTIEYLSGRIGGLQFRLYGDDGHLYIGSHMDTVGPTGWVAAGTLIGSVGDTGNARGSNPHLHFEIHPGNGAAANPYPTLQSFGC